MIETIVAAALTVSLLISLVVILVLGICPGKKQVAIPDVPMNGGGMNAGGFGSAPQGMPSVVPPGFNVPPAGNLAAAELGQSNFTSPTGVMNNMEAPETFRNDGKFDMSSVNFSNISDFRGDNLANSSQVQDERAKSRGISGNLQPVPAGVGSDSEEEYDTEYDTEEESENERPQIPKLGEYDDQGPAPIPPQRITIEGRPGIPSLNNIEPKPSASMNGPPPGLSNGGASDPRDSYRTGLEDDFAAGIQRNPGSPSTSFETNTKEKMAKLLAPTNGGGGSRFNIESLSFNRNSTDGYGGNAVTRDGTSVVSDISGVTGVTGVKGEKKRKKVKRRKRKKKIDANGASVRIRKSKVGLHPVGAEEVQRSHKKKKRRSKNPNKSAPQSAALQALNADDSGGEQ